MSTWERLLRPDLRDLVGYSHASPERDAIRLHANEDSEDPGGSRAGLNRYPVPDDATLRQALATYYGTRADQVLPTRGSDDAIDLLVRAFCRAGQDGVLFTPPTFGIYALAARLQNAKQVKVPLSPSAGFEPDLERIVDQVTDGVHLVFLCTPNNPTGNVVDPEAIRTLAGRLAERALLVIDEAYVEFSAGESVAPMIDEAENLLVLRTLSKAFGLAGIRCGALLGQATMIERLRDLLPPYPLPTPTLDAAVARLRPEALERMSSRIQRVQQERDRLATGLAAMSSVRRVWPSQGNFLLIEPLRGSEWFCDACRAGGLLVRPFPKLTPDIDAVRVTIGQPEENDRILDVARSLEEARDV